MKETNKVTLLNPRYDKKMTMFAGYTECGKPFLRKGIKIIQIIGTVDINPRLPDDFQQRIETIEWIDEAAV